MMGPKTLREIDRELKAALTEELDNPIEWLEQQIRELGKKKGKGKPAATEVFESLLHLFQRRKPKKRRKRRIARAEK